MRARVLACTFLVLAAVAAAGCDDPPEAPGGGSCGDGVCSSFESFASCPRDCAAAAVCGDGVCGDGESCQACSADCGPCAPPCDTIELGSTSTLDVDLDTTSAPSRLDAASCGDGATGPLARYRWVAPSAGRYRLAIDGGFAVVVTVTEGSCAGPTVACLTAAVATPTATELGVAAGQPITIAIAGRDGAAGGIHLHVEREPDVCGDGVCEASEACADCDADCGACPPPAYCGDGVCDPNEDCDACAYDCGDCPVRSYCGDGVCDANEDCDACAYDCGDCPPPSYCGDGTCDLDEDCRSCADDCGDCQPMSYCGDGTCDAYEYCDTCPDDCGSCR